MLDFFTFSISFFFEGGRDLSARCVFETIDIFPISGHIILKC